MNFDLVLTKIWVWTLNGMFWLLFIIIGLFIQMNLNNVKVPKVPGGGAASALLKVGIIGGLGLYAATQSLYNVDGGHRAIMFNRKVSQCSLLQYGSFWAFLVDESFSLLMFPTRSHVLGYRFCNIVVQLFSLSLCNTYYTITSMELLLRRFTLRVHTLWFLGSKDWSFTTFVHDLTLLRVHLEAVISKW